MIHVALWVASFLFLSFVGFHACRYAVRGFNEVVTELAGNRIDPVAVKFLIAAVVFGVLVALFGH